MNSAISRLKGVLLQQKEMEQEKSRIAGEVADKKAENKKQTAENEEKEEKRRLEKKVMDEDIKALQCQTKTIQQAKQDRVDAANKKTAVLKEQNRILQERLFALNQDATKLSSTASKQSIQNKDAES